MASELQDLVDRLGHVLQRSVAVDDPELRIIVYSKHYGDEDAARMQALVGRGAVGHIREYLAGHRINTWREPRYMDADESLGLKRRLVIPLWSGRMLLGFVWIIVAGDLESGELEVSLDASREITGILARRADEQAGDELRTSGLIRDLVAGGPVARGNAALALGVGGAFAGARYFTVLLVLHALPAVSGVEGNGIPGRDAVRRAMVTRPRDSHGLAAVDGGTAVLLGTRSPLDPAAAADLGRRVHQEIHAAGEPALAGAVVGVGDPVERLDEAFSSFDQARVAARAAVADTLEWATWAGLGPAALLPALVRRPLEQHLVPEGFHSMLASQGVETLRLIETYLEAAGSAADTAQRLHMHRSSVYYQLGQFQKATGWDLGDGDVRFHVHLWLKTRKLAFSGETGGAVFPEVAKS